jgi:hypothetical protein
MYMIKAEIEMGHLPKLDKGMVLSDRVRKVRFKIKKTTSIHFLNERVVFFSFGYFLETNTT